MHRNSQAKSVGSACLTCLGNPCSRRRLGTCRRHTVTWELTRQGGLPSVRLQPSHGAPSQLRVTTWGPLCCSVCALCNSWSVVYRRAPGTIRYSAGLPTKAGAPCTQSPLPTRNLLGPGKSRAPPPQLQPALSVSGLLSPGSRSGSWSFSSHAFPPVLPLHHRPFQPSHPPTLPDFPSRESLSSSRRLPVIVLRIRLPSQTNLRLLSPLPFVPCWLSGQFLLSKPPPRKYQATMSSRRDYGSGTPSNASARQNEYFIPRDGIDREVITADICRYLGNDALVRPGTYEV